MTVEAGTGRAAGDLAAAAQHVLASAAMIAASPAGDQGAAWRATLLEVVHESLMRARTDGSAAPPADLAELAAALREVPETALSPLPPRVEILLALLRGGYLEPAWMLAHDNASGQVRPTRTVATWAGRSALRDPLPMPCHIADGQVFAHLPGFRDPRWPIDDEIYRLDRRIRARAVLDGAEFRGEQLRLYGAGYLTLLRTGAQDAVCVVLTGPGGARHQIPATRARRPDLTKPTGEDLTRLAFAGWSAALPLRSIAAEPGRWRLTLQVTQQGVSRTVPLGVTRGPLAAAELIERRGLTGGPVVTEIAGCAVRLGSDGPEASRPGQLFLQVRRLPLRTRMLPRALRAALRG